MRIVIPPLRRDALARRAQRDADDEARACEAEDPAERIELSLELSELARETAESVGADWIRFPPNDLSEKARLYARPLALLKR